MSFLVSRLKYIPTSYSDRINRFVFHIFFIEFYKKARLEHWVDWIVDFCLYTLDLVLIPDLFDLIHNFYKPLRKLSEEELAMANKIFSNEIDYSQIYITEKTIPFKPRLFFAYVSFNSINCIKEIPPSILIHELVHIWQYQRYGSVYIYRALKAQNSKAGYDYGGIKGLMDKLKKEDGLLEFNFEQQAEIIEDYYKLSSQSIVDRSALDIYSSYVRQLYYKNVQLVA
jgi:hypothetical protein